MYTLLFLISFILVFISTKYVHKNIRNFNYSRLVRHFAILLILLLPLLILNTPKFIIYLNLNYILLSILCGIFISLLDFITLLQLNNGSYFKIALTINHSFIFTRLNEVILIPIAEECLFRGTINIESVNYIYITTSIICFILAHNLNHKLRIINNLQLIILSIINILVYFYTKNIFYPILIHIIFNTPMFLTYLRLYYYQKGLKYD